MQFGPGPQHTAKVAFPADKADWHASVLPGPIVLVSTVDAAGRPNIAPKSFVSMMAFGGPLLAFGCNRSHATARNAEAAREFVVNFPPEALATHTALEQNLLTKRPGHADGDGRVRCFTPHSG